MDQTNSIAAPRATPDPPGAVRITRHVLAQVIEHSALGVAGVDRLAPIGSPWRHALWRAEPQHGLAMTVHGATVTADLYLILKPGVNMAQVGRGVQDAVATAIEELLGMTAGPINCYIQDIA